MTEGVRSSQAALEGLRYTCSVKGLRDSITQGDRRIAAGRHFCGTEDSANQRLRSQRIEEPRRHTNALILFDVMLPKKDGFDVCRELRRSGVESSILLLTARTAETEKVLGLDLGADDYITKPYSPKELRARIRARLRRGGPGGRVRAQRTPDARDVRE